MNGLLVVAIVVALAWALANHGNDDEADGERGRFTSLKQNHPKRHLVTPAIGRKGWARR